MGDHESERRDRRLEADVRSRLDRGDAGQFRSMARYEVAVAEGRATLSGHVRSRQVARSIATMTGGVRGVASVDDRLVADEELVSQVASAIGRTAVNRTSRLVVRSEFGHLRIGGVYASPDAHDDALRVGAGVPGVLTVSAARPSDLIV